MGRRRVALAALCALVVIVVWLLMRATTSPDAATTSSADGVPTCPLASLPSEARNTLRLIRTDGPFPYPRNDGVVFGNREGHLPDRAKGYYHEYTVITPGAQNRSTRRVVTGGVPLTDPPQYFYTDDHYDSFCLITDAGGRG